ncbi:uncharacterized protein LOC133198180 [Saccostrea echinata]|uniref:uncharacterized protein LOC133198180 n=1 Tax=Saccostrea echinata TaxID=191078 RepID=UPI002A816460|nr:uncharacterized protein LOC133198180 [Saccostrea echinata]
MTVWHINIIFFLTLVDLGALLGVIKEEQIGVGFCHNDTKRIQVNIDCNFTCIRVTVNGNSNEIENCHNYHNGNVSCVESGMYNETCGFVEYSFTFNHTRHAGEIMWINYTCINRSDQSKNITLYPCLSSFRANATHNTTHAFIVCKNIFFNMSKEISILNAASLDPIETCRWNLNTSSTQCHVQNHANTVTSLSVTSKQIEELPGASPPGPPTGLRPGATGGLKAAPKPPAHFLRPPSNFKSWIRAC